MKHPLPSSRAKTFRWNLRILAAHAFFSELRFYYPVAVLAFQSVMGSFTEAMGIFAVMGFAQALFEIPTGIYSDKIGRRNTLIVGSSFAVLGALCMALAFRLSHGPALLYLGGALMGFASSLHSGNTDALIYETLLSCRKESYASFALGRQRAMEQAALALSGVFTGALFLVNATYNELMLFTLASLSIGFLLSLFIVSPPQSVKNDNASLRVMKEALKHIIKNKNLRLLALASCLKNGVGQAGHSLTPGFVETVWPLWLTPLFRTAQNGVGMFSFLVSGKIVKRLGLKKSLLNSAVVSSVLSCGAYLMTSLVSPVLLLVNQVTYAVNLTATNTLQQRSFSSAQRSTMGSIISLGGALVGGLAAFLAGALADAYGPATSLLALLIITLPSIPLYLALVQKECPNGKDRAAS